MNGKTVYLGDASDINTRMLYLKGILEEEKGTEGDVIINGEMNSERGVIFRRKV